MVEDLGVGASYGDRSLHEQSHGESFIALVNRFHGEGLYLLDEPEAALSPSRQLSVITRIHDLVQQRSQFIIATHSPIIMAYPDAHIYSFSTSGIQRIPYKDTEHFRITRDFLANPQTHAPPPHGAGLRPLPASRCNVLAPRPMGSNFQCILAASC
jgi:predicted ATPase